MGQQALAECGRRPHRGRAAGAVADPRHFHRDPVNRCHPAAGGAGFADGRGAGRRSDLALALLERPVWSPARKIAMLTLSGYLVVAILLLAVKAVQLALARP